MEVKATGVKVPYTYAENTRQFLFSHQIIDKTLSFKKQKKHLVIPVRKSIEETKKIFLEFSFVKEVKIKTFEFKKKRLKPNNLTQALEEILAEELHQYIPKSFDIVGDIAIIDIPDKIQHYKDKIGEILLTLFPAINTVYRKASAVSGKLRTRDLELLFGENKCETIHTEYGIKIAVDVCKTYFSPRLGNEHKRVAKLVKNNEVVVDLFTGVGPFPLHIAKETKAKIYALDINKIAIKMLEKSISLNKLVGEIIPKIGNARSEVNHLPKADRIIMNLPGSAIEFVDAITNLLKKGTKIHFYAFVKKDTVQKKIVSLLEEELNKYGWKIKEVFNYHKVRESAPYEIQACLEVSVLPI